MDLWDIFRSMSALKAMFELGYIPKKEEFYELTPEQYEKYYETAGKGDERGEKIFMLLPDDVQKYNELASGDVFSFTEQDISDLEKGVQIVDSYCKRSDKKFETFEEKLYYTASLLPDIFTEGTKFEKKRLIYLNDKTKNKS